MEAARVDPDKAAREIAETLTPSDDLEVDADLVIMVHGVNTPRDRALDFHGKALAAVENDRDQLFGDAGRRTVCSGITGGVVLSRPSHRASNDDAVGLNRTSKR